MSEASQNCAIQSTGFACKWQSMDPKTRTTSNPPNDRLRKRCIWGSEMVQGAVTTTIQNAGCVHRINRIQGTTSCPYFFFQFIIAEWCGANLYLVTHSLSLCWRSDVASPFLVSNLRAPTSCHGAEFLTDWISYLTMYLDWICCK